LGIVVDPQKSAVAAFECRDGEVEELPGLLLTADRATSGAARQLLHSLSFPGAGHGSRGILGRLINDK
jgi:hypothetical protein